MEPPNPDDAREVPQEAVEYDAPIIPFARSSKRMQRHSAKREREGAGRIPVVYYGRLSRNRDGTITGLARQEAETLPWATLRGWDVVRQYTDDDTGAFSLKRKRPGFESLMADLDSGEVKGVVVWKLDRLVRRTIDWVRVLPRAEETPWFAASFSEGVNTADPMGRLLAGILVQMAELEATNIRLRTQSKHSELAKAGRWSGGGDRAFGHTPDRKGVVPIEAEALREVADRIIRGETLFSIAANMERQGVRGPDRSAKGDRPPRYGGPISSSVWRRMLLSPRVIGKRLADDGDLSENVGMAPILDEETARQVWAVLDRPSGSAGVGTARSHLLSGLLVCGQCGSRLKAWKDKGHNAFACLKVPAVGGCGQTAIREAPVETLVVEAAIRYLKRFDLSSYAKDVGAGADALLLAIRKEDAALEDLALARFDARTITEGEFQAARVPILRRREDLARKFASRTMRPPLIGNRGIREAWVAWDFLERRRALETAIDRVTVGPGLVPRVAGPDGSYPYGRPTRRARTAERLKIDLRRL